MKSPLPRSTAHTKRDESEDVRTAIARVVKKVRGACRLGLNRSLE